MDDTISFGDAQHLLNKDVLNGGCAPLGRDLKVYNGSFKNNMNRKQSNIILKMSDDTSFDMNFKLYVQESPSPEGEQVAIRCQIEFSRNSWFQRVIYYNFDESNGVARKVIYKPSENKVTSSTKKQGANGVEYHKQVTFVPYAKSITTMETNKTNQLDKLKIETAQLLTPAGNGLQNVNKANVIGLNLVFIYLIIELLNPKRNNVTIFDASTVFPVTFIVDFVSLIKQTWKSKPLTLFMP